MNTGDNAIQGDFAFSLMRHRKTRLYWQSSGSSEAITGEIEHGPVKAALRFQGGGLLTLELGRFHSRPRSRRQVARYRLERPLSAQ